MHASTCKHLHLDVLGTNACKCMHIMSAVLFLYAPQPSAEVSQRFAASIVIVGAPSPAHSKARNQTPPVATRCVCAYVFVRVCECL